MELVVEGAELIWTGPVGGSIACAEGVVVAVAPPDAIRLDATGCVVTPGLVNAHHHLLQSAFRTRPGTRQVAMADWLAAMAAAYRDLRVDPKLGGHAARVGLAESLLCGVTTVADHHLTWPADVDPVELAIATVLAAEEVGARLVFVRGTAGDDPERAAASVEAMVDTGLFDGRRVQLAVGPAGVHSDGPETFAALAEVAGRLRLRRRTQCNEQIDVERSIARHGRRPLAMLDEWGWLAPDVTLAHLCGVTAGEVSRLARAGVSATHAPGCDLPMGWGVAPVADMRAAGVAVGLGTSGGGSNDAGHLLADARLAMQVGAGSLTAIDVLTMATAGSAAGLGRSDLGTLQPGAAADLCCWDVTDVFDAGVSDPLAGLVWAAPGRRPRHVVVAGRVVVRDGELVTADSRVLAADLRAELAARTP